MARTMKHPWDTIKKISIPIWFNDIEKENIYVSESLRKELETNMIVLDRKDLNGLIHKDDLTHMDHREVVSRNEERSFFYISYRLLKNDQYEWVKDIVTPFYNEDDRLIGYTGVNAPDIAHKEELDRIKKR